MCPLFSNRSHSNYKRTKSSAKTLKTFRTKVGRSDEEVYFGLNVIPQIENNDKEYICEIGDVLEVFEQGFNGPFPKFK